MAQHHLLLTRISRKLSIHSAAPARFACPDTLRVSIWEAGQGERAGAASFRRMPEAHQSKNPAPNNHSPTLQSP